MYFIYLHCCIYWIRRYILCHKKCHPQDMGSVKIEAFLTHLFVNRRIACPM
ncbi:phage integrase N-terminal SAM-like domain-containing protein [Nodularia spumigena]|uniref:phage integrase N-terminal SAM-like domain-containing protein n=1 Tax=Nodularia spumigena TaxID=70799 RepID=UPI000D322B75